MLLLSWKCVHTTSLTAVQASCCKCNGVCPELLYVKATVLEMQCTPCIHVKGSGWVRTHLQCTWAQQVVDRPLASPYSGLHPVCNMMSGMQNRSTPLLTCHVRCMSLLVVVRKRCIVSGLALMVTHREAASQLHLQHLAASHCHQELPLRACWLLLSRCHVVRHWVSCQHDPDDRCVKARFSGAFALPSSRLAGVCDNVPSHDARLERIVHLAPHVRRC
jgi:hypothetical protein